jgi:hypothetical protein
MSWTTIILMAIAGAMGAALANRGIAVFHDGLRPLVPEVIGGRMQRREFGALASSMSFGLLVGYGLPFSMVSGVVLYHSLWLGTDVIGAQFPGPTGLDGQARGRVLLGLIGAALAGGIYGALLAAGLAGVRWLFAHLPIPLERSLQEMGAPIVLTFALFPAVAVAYQHGAGHGLLAFLLTLLARQVAGTLGLAGPDTWALGAGMAVLVAYAMLAQKRSQSGQGAMAVSTQGAARIRHYLLAIALLGAVYGLICNQAVMMESPQSLLALAQGERAAAIGVTIARGLCFAPLKTMSAVATGVFAMDGFGFVAAAGLLAPNAVGAALAGAIVMSLEALSLVALSRLLCRWPVLSQTADAMRTAMTKLLEIASLVGGMLAANSLAPGLGFVAVAGLYALNEAAGLPVMRAAAGPVAVLLFGLGLNLFAWIAG